MMKWNKTALQGPALPLPPDGPCLHYLSMPGPGVQRRWASVTRSQCPRVYLKEGDLWDSPLAPSLLLSLCLCSLFHKEVNLLVPIWTPLPLEMYPGEGRVCWFILRPVWGLCLLLHACNCLNANYRPPCVGKSIKLEKVLLCWNT